MLYCPEIFGEEKGQCDWRRMGKRESNTSEVTEKARDWVRELRRASISAASEAASS